MYIDLIFSGSQFGCKPMPMYCFNKLSTMNYRAHPEVETNISNFQAFIIFFWVAGRSLLGIQASRHYILCIVLFLPLIP